MAGDLTGRILGDYELMHCIGSGGFSDVYMGKNTALPSETFFAVKVFKEYTLQIEKEAEIGRKLEHPNIVKAGPVLESEGIWYMPMELCEEENLRDKIASSAGIASNTALMVTNKVLSGLQYAHDKGVVHRDIKPENILFDFLGNPKICDFGLQKELRTALYSAYLDSIGQNHVTVTNPNLVVFRQSSEFIQSMLSNTESIGRIVGTLEYMAPEQKEGKADQRTDLFAVGTMLYEMLQGYRPDGTYEPCSDPALDRIIQKSRQRDPNKRYQTADEMKSDLESVIDDNPAHFPSVPAPNSVAEDFCWGQDTEIIVKPSSTNMPNTQNIMTSSVTRESKNALISSGALLSLGGIGCAAYCFAPGAESFLVPSILGTALGGLGPLAMLKETRGLRNFMHGVYSFSVGAIGGLLSSSAVLFALNQADPGKDAQEINGFLSVLCGIAGGFFLTWLTNSSE